MASLSAESGSIIEDENDRVWIRPSTPSPDAVVPGHAYARSCAAPATKRRTIPAGSQHASKRRSGWPIGFRHGNSSIVGTWHA